MRVFLFLPFIYIYIYALHLHIRIPFSYILHFPLLGCIYLLYFRAPLEFLCKMQFRNNLPDIPFDPKLLVLPQDSMRYTKCIIGSSLENSYKYSIFTEPDLGIPINLIDTNIYKVTSLIHTPLID